MSPLNYHPGLEGVVAAETRLSHVDGAAGRLIIAGYPLEELAPRASFEEVVFLLWQDRLPTAAELEQLRQTLAARRALPELTLTILRAAAATRLPAMDALRLALDSLAVTLGDAGLEEQALRLVAAAPTIVATYWRLRQGRSPVAPDPRLGHAANYLFMLDGSAPSAERARALETYLNTVADHGLNASTFTARVIISTGSDLVSAITGAIGALKGPLHGGAPGPALETVFEIGTPERAEAVLRAKLAAGERLMGFGHRVYRVRDPRADVLQAAAERLYASDGDRRLYELARHVESVALALLAERKPERRLQTNVEFYTALLLHGLGLDQELFSPTFAVSRLAGWTAHCFEQRAHNRIIRPASAYIGPQDRRWTPLEARG
ncbi:citrate synthase [Kallotenue papyrolyticum]|uniref:citrate synthase n=1 Tax=Kallotenue papyrolyticum TaxID=1325125 RepID=UPI000492824C|nr:citrate synthase/methylcitrate synthase [Kallotenue papyrolyticum]